MNLNIRELMQRLIDLQTQAEKIDKALKDVRIETNNIIWDLAETIKKNGLPNRYKKIKAGII